MAHMIDTLAWHQRTPWHGLGEKMTEVERRSLDAAIERANIGWSVEAHELTDHLGRKVPDAQGIIRTDSNSYLSTVGGSYTPIQNHEALSIVRPLIDEGYTVDVLGSLDGGRRVFGLLRMPEATINVADADDVNGYLCVITSHDGTSATRGILTPIRVVCQNTLSMALGSKHAAAVSIRHTSSAPARISDARELMSAMHKALAATGDTFRKLADQKLNLSQLRDYINAVIPNPAGVADADLSSIIKNRRAAIADLVFNGRGNAGAAGLAAGEASAWHAYNAVTEYFDHVRPREAGKPSAAIGAAESAIFGANAQLKARALALASAQLVAA